uniref:Uncharacterized protein n=2 Tax=Palpitomonas bilix TaxID=652834 RepID=A0A7S3DHD0_9EUKA
MGDVDMSGGLRSYDGKKRRMDAGTLIEPVATPVEQHCLDLIRFEGLGICNFESPIFRHFVEALNPEVNLPTRKRLKALLNVDLRRPIASAFPAPPTPPSNGSAPNAMGESNGEGVEMATPVQGEKVVDEKMDEAVASPSLLPVTTNSTSVLPMVPASAVAPEPEKVE